MVGDGGRTTINTAFTCFRIPARRTTDPPRTRNSAVTFARNSPEGAAYHALRNLAKISARPFSELLTLHALDGFLTRLQLAPERHQLILKGGLLLAAYEVRRPTADVDLLAMNINNDVETVLRLIRRVAETEAADGVHFATETATASVIRDEDSYTGVRVSMFARVATAEIRFHIDINVGDPVIPSPQEVDVPLLLGGTAKLLGYPIAMIHAEKLVTAAARGRANTRWRDFGDVFTLSSRHPVDGNELIQALASVASHRDIELRPLSTILNGFDGIAQSRYLTWKLKHQRDDLPDKFAAVLDRVCGFADPALSKVATGKMWSPVDLRWVQ